MASAPSSSRRDSWWRNGPVLLIAVLALVMSTAGGAYAVAKNSIGTKQLKNSAVTGAKIKNSTITSSDVKNESLTGSDLRNSTVTGSDVKNGSLTKDDLAPGTLPKPAGTDKVYFAKVRYDGLLLAKSKGILSASNGGSGYYSLATDFDTDGCAVVATTDSSDVNISGVPNGTTPYFYAKNVNVSPATYINTGFTVVIAC